MRVTIPGALADHLTDEPPLDLDTRAALDSAHRGRGRTLVFEPRSMTALHVISRRAEQLLADADATEPQKRAARTWLKRAGHAPQATPTVEEVEARYAAQLVTEADATDGTWRGEWIGERTTTTAPALFDLDAEQGSLFA